MKWGIAVMSSKTSFINTGILRHDFKRYGWIGAAYLLGLLLSVPLQIAMIYSRQAASGVIYSVSPNPYPYLQVLGFQSPLQALLWFTVPVLTGILLFRYLQSESLLIRRMLCRSDGTLYNTHMAAGVVLLLCLIITSLVHGRFCRARYCPRKGKRF